MPRGSEAVRKLLHPLYRTLERRAHVLRYLFVEITQRCNLSCLHCGSDCGREPRPDELSTEEWLGVFRSVRERFPPRSVLLAVTGGEPFCRPDFDRILEGLLENGHEWGMVTNGWALTASNLRKVMAAGLASLTVSLDGLAASHDWLRGRPGSFERAIAGIRRAREAGLLFLDVVTCVNPRNLPELPHLFELLRELGVPQWRLFCIAPKGRARTNRALLLEPEQLRTLFDWMASIRREHPGSTPRLQFSCEGYLPPRLDAQVRDEPYFCRAGVNIASVLCDGAISACPNLSRSFVQGNVRTDDLLEVWESRFGPLRDRGWMRQGACARCAEWGRCNGNSLHLWDDEARAPSLCHFERLRGVGR